MTTPDTPGAPVRNHMCQTGCGRPAEVVIVRLTESDTDILCDTCTVAMFVAIAQQVVSDAGVQVGAESATTA